MKLLFDENLSRKLVVRLAELYPGSAHVAEFDLLERPDREIRDFARSGGFVIVTTDGDFYELAAALGPPPKVIWLPSIASLQARRIANPPQAASLPYIVRARAHTSDRGKPRPA